MWFPVGWGTLWESPPHPIPPHEIHPPIDKTTLKQPSVKTHDKDQSCISEICLATYIPHILHGLMLDLFSLLGSSSWYGLSAKRCMSVFLRILLILVFDCWPALQQGFWGFVVGEGEQVAGTCRKLLKPRGGGMATRPKKGSYQFATQWGFLLPLTGKTFQPPQTNFFHRPG